MVIDSEDVFPGTFTGCLGCKLLLLPLHEDDAPALSLESQHDVDVIVIADVGFFVPKSSAFATLL